MARSEEGSSPGLVPSASFTEVDPDVGGAAQRGGDRSEQGPCPLGRACNVDVIQVGEQVFTGLEFVMPLDIETFDLHEWAPATPTVSSTNERSFFGENSELE